MSERTTPPIENAPDDDPAVEGLLRAHLADLLGPHLGRCRERFDRDRDARAARPIRRRAWWSVGVGGLATAAAVGLWLRPTPGPVPARPAGRPNPTVVAATVAPADEPGSVRQDARWRTVDQGLVRLGDGSLARQLLVRRVDRFSYVDPARNATVEYAVPREQTVFVGLNDN